MACVLIGAPLFLFCRGSHGTVSGLFADDHASLGQQVDRLDQIPASELTAKWPKALSELVDVLACELIRGGMAQEQAKAQARKLALVQAHYLG